MRIISAECILAANATLAEGPVWHEDRLWWVDIEEKQIHCFNPNTSADQHWQLDTRIGFIIPTAQSDFIAGTQQGIGRFDPSTGKLTFVANPEAHLPENRFNDGKCDSAGRLWAGTMAVSESDGCGSLYRITRELTIEPVVQGVTISNGLAWSSDDRTMFYIDSPTQRIDAFEFEPLSGELSSRRVAVKLEQGNPDGMCIDAAGNLWVAVWGGWGVSCFDPHTGTQLAEVEVPVEAVTSCCFGGPDLTDLFITTASRDLDEEGKRNQPLAGSIFRAKVRVRGTPTQLFRD